MLLCLSFPQSQIKGGVLCRGGVVRGQLMWLVGHRQTGLVMLGSVDDPKLEACRRSLGAREFLDATALAQRFPGLQLHAGEVAVWDGTGGVLFADRALRAVQVGAAEGRGRGYPGSVPAATSCHHPHPGGLLPARGHTAGWGEGAAH